MCLVAINVLLRWKNTSVMLSIRPNVQFMLNKEQDAQLSQRDRAAGCVIVFAKSRTL